MRVISLLLKVVVFFLLLGFAIKNTGSVAVRYFFGLEWQAPLVFVLLIFFAAGIAGGLIAGLAIMTGQRRELLKLKRELRTQTRSAATPLTATAESL